MVDHLKNIAKELVPTVEQKIALMVIVTFKIPQKLAIVVMFLVLLLPQVVYPTIQLNHL